MKPNRTINLKQAKAQLSELVSLAESGEEVTITRHGRPVARLTAAREDPQPVSLERLQSVTDEIPRQDRTAAELVREMRDQARY